MKGRCCYPILWMREPRPRPAVTRSKLQWPAVECLDGCSMFSELCWKTPSRAEVLSWHCLLFIEVRESSTQTDQLSGWASLLSQPGWVAAWGFVLYHPFMPPQAETSSLGKRSLAPRSGHGVAERKVLCLSSGATRESLSHGSSHNCLHFPMSFLWQIPPNGLQRE